MSNTSRLTIAAVLVALLSGCASQNPYDNQGQQSSGGMSKTAKYGGLGALAGAVAGAAIRRMGSGVASPLPHRTATWGAAFLAVAAVSAASPTPI